MVVSVSVGSVKSQSAMGSQPQAINDFDLRYRPLISAAARRPGALAAPICRDQKWLHTRANAIDATDIQTIPLREPLPEPPRHDAYLRHVARRQCPFPVARDNNTTIGKGLDERGLGVFGQTPKIDARRHGLEVRRVRLDGRAESGRERWRIGVDVARQA